MGGKSGKKEMTWSMEGAVSSVKAVYDRPGKPRLRTDHRTQHLGGQEPNHPPQRKSPFLVHLALCFFFLTLFFLPSQVLPIPFPLVTSAESTNERHLWFCVNLRVEGLEEIITPSAPDNSPSQHSLGHCQLHRKRTGSAPSLMPPVSTQHGPL